MICPSLNSHNRSTKSVKFLCSYGGRILPRYPDGKLRYHGGETRVISVERSVSFSGLLAKLREMCGAAVTLRCQLPTEDLDALVSITCDEDLINLFEEYDRAATAAQIKIRAFLSGLKTTKTVSPPPSAAVSPKFSFCSAPMLRRCPTSAPSRRRVSRPPVYPVFNEKYAVKTHGRHQYVYGNGGHVYLMHNGNHSQ